MDEEGEEERWWLLFLWRREREKEEMVWASMGIGMRGVEVLLLWCLREEVRRREGYIAGFVAWMHAIEEK